MNNDEFLTLLFDKLDSNGSFLKSHRAMKESIFNTIKSLLAKKNLVIISKSDLAKLENKAANIHENY